MKLRMRSGFEELIAVQLKNEGIDFSYESLVLPYYRKVVGGVCRSCGEHDVAKRGRYTPDFIIGDPEEPESCIIIETKGNFSSKDRTKMVAVTKEHPKLDIRMLFLLDNKLSRRSKTRYSGWCNTHHIPYAFEVLPDTWIQEFRAIG